MHKLWTLVIADQFMEEPAVTVCATEAEAIAAYCAEREVPIEAFESTYTHDSLGWIHEHEIPVAPKEWKPDESDCPVTSAADAFGEFPDLLEAGDLQTRIENRMRELQDLLKEVEDPSWLRCDLAGELHDLAGLCVERGNKLEKEE